ncbi:MAG: formyltetrahydrofolate deformylase [Candidatus Melainabacteria bacterium GWF2_37_15]|nr:MAG: formyltetrahydrofolate deformylase [Candidatus Melainabacteria bacterium GWF2_37_15]
MPYNNESKYVLTARCPDTTGISASVFNYIHDNDGFVTSSANYGDPSTNRFFLRIVFTAVGPKMGNLEDLRLKFQPIADKFAMQWEINDCSHKPKVLIAVSKFGHCLIDLLHKTKAGQIPMEIAGIVSNHTEMKGLAEWYGADFYHFPVKPETKSEQERKIINLTEELGIELVILARYMQILSPYMCETLKEKCINIHHSFLPSFKGAMPYSQAHERGVKIVGATAHYVTTELDEGPIIEQAVERVDHTFGVDDIASTVRDLETLTLSRAVKWHVEKRILLNGHKTVVFK